MEFWISEKNSRILGFLISATVLTLVIAFSRPQEILSELGDVNLLILSLGFISGNIPIMLSSYSWKLVFSTKGMEKKYLDWLSWKLSCIFVSNSTPMGDLGGEPFISKIISDKTDLSYSLVLSRLAFADTLQNLPYVFFGLFNSLILILVYSAGKPISLGYESIVPALVILGVIAIVILILLQAGVLNGAFSKKFIYEYISCCRKAVVNLRLGALLIGISLSSFLLDVLTVIIVSWALGAGIEAFTLFLVVPVARASNLAPSIGGFGVYEASFSLLISSVSSIGFAEAFSISIVYRGITTYFGLFAGFIGLNHRDLRKAYNRIGKI